MGDNVVLFCFTATPLLLLLSLLLFFRRFRLHKKKGWLLLVTGNLLVFLFLCSLLVLSGEIYFRFIYDSTESFGLNKTTAKWFQRHFHYNRVGLRDSIDYELRKKTGTNRFTFLGDSFTAGHGIRDVQDRYANRVRTALPDSEIHVLARCGWDTQQEIDSLLSLCDRNYELETVVLGYCLNDISDVSSEWHSTLTRINSYSSTNFFITHSYLFNTIYYRWRAASDPDIADYYQFIHGLYDGNTWILQQDRLRYLRDEIERNGGRLVAVTFPFYNAIGTNYRYSLIHSRLDSFWKSAGVPHLDLHDFYESYQPSDLVVSQYDAHPNELAHSIAATAITEFLTKQEALDD